MLFVRTYGFRYFREVCFDAIESIINLIFWRGNVMGFLKTWGMWALIVVGTTALGVFVLARTPWAGVFGLVQKRPTDIGLRAVR